MRRIAPGLVAALAVALAAPGGAHADPFAGSLLAAPSGLVAAYSMDAGSLTDLSGNGNHGTLGGATWSTAGRFGGALSFNGTSNLATVPDAASLDLTTGMTLQVWVRPTALGFDWRTVLIKERPGGIAYDLYAHGTPQLNAPTAEINLGGADQTSNGTAVLATNVWTHLASTYDGATLRLYVNGTQVSQRAAAGSIPTSTGALRIGGNTVYGGEYFAGLIDEVRIYNRALSATEVQTGMNLPIGPADTEAPTAPSGLTATGSLANAQLSWTASTDDVGVVRYNVHRSTVAGFTPSAANRVAQPTGTTYTDVPPGGTYVYKVTAEDAAGNVSAASNETPATPVGDLTAPSAPGTLSAIGAIGQATLTWGPATDNLAVVRYNVHRSTTAGFTPSAANRIAQPTGTSYVDASAPGTYYYRVTAEDAAGNTGPASNQASATIATDAQAPSAPSALTASASAGTVTLGWTASSDNVGVARYNVHRSTTAGFTPSAANRIAQPASAAFSDSGLGSGTYYYRVTAEDAAGNVGGPSNQASATVAIVAPTGLVAAYGFDEGAGTTTADRSGNGNTGTLSNAAWVPGGRYGAALSFNGTSARVNVADSTSLRLASGMTLEAWVRPTVLGDWRTVVLKERTGHYAGALYASTDTSRPSAHVYTAGDHELRGPAAIAVGAWTHLAATYNASTLTLFVNGAAVATQAVTGTIAANTGPLRIGGNAIWGEYFNGLIDEVRVYNRALGASEIQGDMDRSVTPDETAPAITGRTPASGAAGINVGTAPTATFSEPLRASSVTAAAFTLTEQGGPAVAATVSYDAPTSTATLRPQGALRYGVTYQVRVAGGAGGVTDLAGNPLAADAAWSFTTESSPPQILIASAAGNQFGGYVAEILRNEGLNAFTTLDASLITPTLLNAFDVVVLGETALNATQVSTLSAWVNAGGNLIALRPDKQLAGLLGLTDAGTTLANAYLRAQAGSGIAEATLQYHGTADRYTLSGAQAIATLYSTATAATANPAVTLRAVGAGGGEAAAFTFDLARSVVYTRQGNPAWAGQERDGIVAVRPNDMFFGARAGDIQPDWLDTSKIAIPQADEQQRLLMNLITRMARDRLPLPRFWYLPRGEKAVVVLSGDDHSPGQSVGGTSSHFNRYQALSPPGCVVQAWECVRSTSYVYPSATLTNAQAVGYLAGGFEVALHPQVGSCPSVVPTPAQLAAAFDTQLQQFAARYTSVPSPVSSRTHCVEWPDWASEAKIELARGIRMDANYYHYPSSWIGARPGFLNGGGFPMRFADVDGSLIDVYQQNTSMNDEAGQAYPATVDALLDNALGANGYYGAFGANMHTDALAPHPGAEAIVASAQARGVPLISYKQLLTWVDGRNSSTIRSLEYSAGHLDFTTTVGTGAGGLQALLPTQGPSGTLSALTCGGTPRAYAVQTIKGIEYAMFTAVTGTCRATYS